MTAMKARRLRTTRQQLRLAACCERTRGVTLFELLLTTALISLFLGVVAFNFAVLGSGSQLDEGASRFETLLRFARAESANTGREIRIEFAKEESTETIDRASALESDESTTRPPQIRVVQEVDPLLQPGEYIPVNASWARQEFGDLIEVGSVRLVGATRAWGGGAAPRVDSDEDGTVPLSPVTFYPDGSSDSADVTLVSRSSSDRRRLVIHLVGLTGTITRSEAAPQPIRGDEETVVEAPDGTDTNSKAERPRESQRETHVERTPRGANQSPSARRRTAPRTTPPRSTRPAPGTANSSTRSGATVPKAQSRVDDDADS